MIVQEKSETKPLLEISAPAVSARVNVLGIGISPTTIPKTLRTIEQWIATGAKRYVCVTSVNGVVESQKDPELSMIHNRSGLTVPDGMPMVWLCRRAGYVQTERVYGPDLMLAMCKRAAEKGYTCFLYGGKEGVPELLRDALQAKFPNLQVVGTYSPPFRPMTISEDQSVIDMINEANPDIIWVGLSTPKQERWMSDHRSRLKAPVLLGVGAAFDFHTGQVPQAPPWMQRNGLEWLFRLVQEPRRLWRRYIIGNPYFLILLVLQWLGLRNFGRVD